MVVYITANSLVGSLLMVPMTLMLFEIGKGLQQSDGEHVSAQEVQFGASVKGIIRGIIFNPVIFMTVLGLLFKLLFSHTFTTDASGKQQLPEPFNSVINFWTGPFPMLALLL